MSTNHISTANINHAKLRCMNLLFRLAGNLRSIDFPKEERDNARLALEEFKLLQETLFTCTTDAEYEPSRETITLAMDELELTIRKTEPRLNLVTTDNNAN